MAIVKMIPHSPVRIETFMVFSRFFIAAETIPEMPVTIKRAEGTRPTNVFQAVPTAKMLDGLAAILEEMIIAHSIGAGKRWRHF